MVIIKNIPSQEGREGSLALPPLATRTLTAYKDCWVNSNKPDINRNKDGIGIGRLFYLNRALVGFDLDGLDINEEDVKSAEIRLYGKALRTPLIVEAHYTHTSWGETTITWNNQPPPTTYHWDGGNTSLMGSTTNVPSAAEGWFSIPIEIAFIKNRWGRKLWAILKGYEGASDSYCYTEDREAGAYAPQLVLYTEAVGEAKGFIVVYTRPNSATPGDTVTIWVQNVQNIGTGSGSFRLRLIDKDENVEVDSTSWFTLAAGASTSKTLTGTMPDKDWNLTLILERTLPTGAVAVDDEKKFTAINIVNWWDAIRAGWNSLAWWQKALIVTGSTGGLIGGASLWNKRKAP